VSAFGRLWTASGISNLGDGVTAIAIPLLAATLTRDPFRIAVVNAAQFLPWLLFGLPIGALVDRWDRKRTMWVADLLRAGTIGGLAALVAAGRAGIGTLVLAAFLLGTGMIFFDGSAQAAIPAVVSREPAALQRANLRLNGTFTVARGFLGQPVGGALFAAAHWLPFGADAVSFVASSALVGTIRGRFGEREPAAGERRQVRHDIAEGLRWLRGHRLMRAFTLMLCGMNLANAAAYGLLVLLAQDRLHLSSAGFGALLTIEALGALGGSLLSTRLSRWLGMARAIIVGELAVGVGTLLVGIGPDVAVVALGLLISPFAGGVWIVLGHSLRQELTPARMLGRVLTVQRMLAIGAIPVGAALGGLLARQVGVTTTYLVAAVVLIAIPLVSARVITERELAAARAAVA
jgi:MFS family permease